MIINLPVGNKLHLAGGAYESKELLTWLGGRLNQPDLTTVHRALILEQYRYVRNREFLNSTPEERQTILDGARSRKTRIHRPEDAGEATDQELALNNDWAEVIDDTEQWASYLGQLSRRKKPVDEEPKTQEQATVRFAHGFKHGLVYETDGTGKDGEVGFFWDEGSNTEFLCERRAPALWDAVSVVED